jgi:hypothetical protein
MKWIRAIDGNRIMKRIKKALLLPVRSMAYRWNRLGTYYWADEKLNDLQTVHVMPKLYYRWLYQGCLWLAESARFRRLADRAIHTIPYHIRFHVA